MKTKRQTSTVPSPTRSQSAVEHTTGTSEMQNGHATDHANGIAAESVEMMAETHANAFLQQVCSCADTRARYRSGLSNALHCCMP